MSQGSYQVGLLHLDTDTENDTLTCVIKSINCKEIQQRQYK